MPFHTPLTYGIKKSTPGYLVFAILFLVFNSCSPPKPEASSTPAAATTDSTAQKKESYFTNCKTLFANASRMDSILLQQTELNKALANEAIKAFTDFAFYCQSDTMSPIYLIKTAQVARAINNIPQAKLVLDKCIDDYPSFKDRAAAIFLLAQLYDEPTYLNNENEAKKLYEKIINEYPKSDWASSAKGAITFIGKSDKEIIEALKKKNK